MVKQPAAIITWDDSWKIGVADIDSDHKNLVKLLQKVFGVIITSQGPEHIREALHELIDYTRYHFNREERIYADHDFPLLEEHKQLHHDLIRQVLDLSDEIHVHGESAALSDSLYEFLKKWLLDHILKEDLKFKEFLETSG